MDKIIKLEQWDANRIKCFNPVSSKFVQQALAYKSKEMAYNPHYGRMALQEVSKSFATTIKSVTTFPAGLLEFVKEKAKKQRKLVIYNQLEIPRILLKFKPELPNIKFEDYQSTLLGFVGIHKRGILVSSTGSGKSIIIGGIISKLRIPKTVIVCPNRTIFSQLFESMEKWFGRNMVGMFGSSIYNESRINVCMYQSLKKCHVKPELLIVDEGHEVNPSIVNFITKNCVNTHYRYGMTATPQRFESNFEKAASMVGYIGPILHEVDESLVSARVLPVVVKFVKWHSSVIGKNPTYQKVLREYILFDETRNTNLLKAAKEELDNGRNTLVLIDEIEQGKRMHEIAGKLGIESHLVHGKMKPEEIDKIKKDLNDRKINFAIATKVFGVGTDIPNVDCIVLGSSRKSHIDTVQKIGRGRRRTKHFDDLVVIDSMDSFKQKVWNKIVNGHSMQRLQTYEEKKWTILKS